MASNSEYEQRRSFEGNKFNAIIEEIDGIMWFTPTSQLESGRKIVRITGYEMEMLDDKQDKLLVHPSTIYNPNSKI